MIRAGGTLLLDGAYLNNAGGLIEANSLWTDLDGRLDNTRGRIQVAELGAFKIGGDRHLLTLLQGREVMFVFYKVTSCAQMPFGVMNFRL